MRFRQVTSFAFSALLSTTACASDAVRAIDALIGVAGSIMSAAAKQPQKEAAAAQQQPLTAQQKNDPEPLNQEALLEGLLGGKATETKPDVASKGACKADDYLDYGFMVNWKERLLSYPPTSPANSQNPDPYNLISFEKLVQKAAEKCGRELGIEKENREKIKALGPRPPQFTQDGYNNHKARWWDENVQLLQYNSTYPGTGLGCFRAENERAPNYPVAEDVLYQRCLATFKDGTTAVSVWFPHLQANYGKAEKDLVGLYNQEKRAAAAETSKVDSARNRDLKFAFKSIAMRQPSGLIEKSGKYDCKEMSSRELICSPKYKVYQQCRLIQLTESRSGQVCDNLRENQAGEEWNSAAGLKIDLAKSHIKVFDGRVVGISVIFAENGSRADINSLLDVMRERYGPETLTDKEGTKWLDKYVELLVRFDRISFRPSDAIWAEMEKAREQTAQGKKAEAEAAQAAKQKERQKQQARDL